MCFSVQPTKVLFCGRYGKQLHRHFGDEAERALVADHDVADVRADRTARHVLDPRDRAVRETRPRGRRPCPRCRRRVSRTGRCCASRRGRPSARSASTAANARSSRRACGTSSSSTCRQHAALHGRLHVVGVDLEDAVHGRAVEHDRIRRPIVSSPPSVAVRPVRGTTLIAMLVGELQHLGRLPGAARHRHGRRQRLRVDADARPRSNAEAVDAAAASVPSRP